LYLRFRSGDVYRYFDFPNETYQQFLLAESKGQFFLTNIRNCLRYERLAKLQVA
jgi:KTSC domain